MQGAPGRAAWAVWVSGIALWSGVGFPGAYADGAERPLRSEQGAASSQESVAAFRACFETLFKEMRLHQGAERRAWVERAVADPVHQAELVLLLRRAYRKVMSSAKAKCSVDAWRKRRGALQEVLKARRATALATIRDEKRYPAKSGSSIQAEVDALVDQVQTAWEGVEDGWEQVAGVQDDLASAVELEGYLSRVGRPVEPDGRVETLLRRAWSGAQPPRDAAVAAESARIMQENEALYQRLQTAGVMNEQEYESVFATNRYRIMMGLTPLRIEPKLIQSGRAHSRDMVIRGFYGHVTPDGVTPFQRMTAFGFRGTAYGENIATGRSGQEAFLSWRGSATHHRSMLDARWSVIGIGQDGTHFTMNVGG